MADIDLTNAKKLRGAHTEQAANRLLAEGWTLINTASGKDESGYPLITYSFAWFKDTPPAEPEY